ncbi:MAG TPA: NfeD family protein [Bacillota bacterium]|nr:NfeD family protein [Bacillota bacterium]
MDIFSTDWIGFVLTGLATLFLIGEILVNMRGLFAVLGIGFITVYFSVYLEADSLTLMIIIYFVGLLLIIIDGKLLNDGTFGILGIIGMLISVAMAAPNFTAGLYAAIGVFVGGSTSFTFLKVFKRRKMWTKIMLADRLTKEAGYTSVTQEHENLLYQRGVAINDLRPVGTIRIGDKEYSAVSNGQWIEKDSQVKVVRVDGTGLQVEKITQ